jgi:hypothetical protein
MKKPKQKYDRKYVPPQMVDSLTDKFGYELFNCDIPCRICGVKFGLHSGSRCPKGNHEGVKP